MPSNDICFVTTCASRLPHLQQSLPLMASQPGTSCVVVDYGCPQGSGDWVERHFAQVKVIRSGPRERFELARARNLGAQASQARWLCFVDADTLLAPDFSRAVLQVLEPGGFYRAHDYDGSASGLCICERADFEKAGGYDAVLQGWGMEDKDLYVRLNSFANVRERKIPPKLCSMIPHADELRVQHYEIKSQQLSSTLNLVYCRAKWDMMRMGVAMDQESTRARLYESVSAGIKSGQGKSFKIHFPLHAQPSLSGAVLTSGLWYELTPPGAQPPAGGASSSAKPTP